MGRVKKSSSLKKFELVSVELEIATHLLHSLFILLENFPVGQKIKLKLLQKLTQD
jgi:hypothetical protein